MEYTIEEVNNDVSNNDWINDVEYNNEYNDVNYNNEDNTMIMSHIINYNENFTVKELLLICEYYGFAKELKSNKFNKEQIIHFLVSFENDIENCEIVFQRHHMWYYINELKKDKFMKKFILW